MTKLPKDTIYHYESKDGLNITVTMTELVRCKDCVYYEHEADDPHKSSCQRLWGGMIECKPESYCSDGITIEDYRRKMARRVNALMDEVEE